MTTVKIAQMKFSVTRVIRNRLVWQITHGLLLVVY